MSLLKIPLILLSAVAIQISFTPPNHSSGNEVVHIHNMLSERILLHIEKYGLSFAKVHTCPLIVTVLIYELCPRDCIGVFLSQKSLSLPCG